MSMACFSFMVPTGDGYPSTGLKLLDVLMVYFLGGFIGSFLGFGAITASETSKDK
jgi:hypothetical protein